MDPNNLLDSFSIGLTALLIGWLRTILGPAVDRHVLGAVSWADLAVALYFLALLILANVLAFAFIRRKKKTEQPDGASAMKGHVYSAVDKPLYGLIWIFGLYFALTPLLLKLDVGGGGLSFVRACFNRLFDVGIFAVMVWVFFRCTRAFEARMAALAAKKQNKVEFLLLPLLGGSLRVIVPVLGLIMALPALHLSPAYSAIIARAGSILLILAVALVLFRTVQVGEKAMLARYDITAADNLQARKVYTQVHVIGRVLYACVFLFGLASILMLFQEVRHVGMSLLASAGVVGVILGFAAQKTIANFFAGFQLALTQPIRQDDVLIVEGAWGRVEEILLTYVVIHVWDDTRLIVPLSYFIEKPFQNWTRVSASLLGQVHVYVDYSLPMDQTRQALKEIIEPHPLWDKRFWNLQVVEATEKTMQLRVLATAADSSKAWDLRCSIREKLISHIQHHHPHCLPQLRARFEGSNIRPGAGNSSNNEGLNLDLEHVP